ADRSAPTEGREVSLQSPHPRTAGELPRAQHFSDAVDGCLVELRAGEFELSNHERATSHTPRMMNAIPTQRPAVTASPSRQCPAVGLITDPSDNSPSATDTGSRDRPTIHPMPLTT